MENDKSKIIYEPSFVIENPKILTSLCVLYDEVLLFNHKSIDAEIKELEELIEKNQINSSDMKKLNFINGPLKVLSSESVLKFYDYKRTNKEFSKINDLELDLDLIDNKEKLVLQTNKKNVNSITGKILNIINNNDKFKVSDFIRTIDLYSVAETYNIPLFSDQQNIIINKNYTDFLSENLALISICDLAIPELNTENPENILIARDKLKDELSEFKAGILELTYLLHQNTHHDHLTYKEFLNECSILVNTKIKSSILNLENRIKTNKNKNIKNMFILGAKLLLSGGNILICGNETKSILENGLSFADNLSGLVNLDKPEHKIASYVLKLNNQINSKSLFL